MSLIINYKRKLIVTKLIVTHAFIQGEEAETKIACQSWVRTAYENNRVRRA